MQKQVILVHGGNTFDSYESYLSYLRNASIESLKRGSDWKEGLQEELGSGFDVILLKMPNKANARYLEWKIWFEKHIPLFADEVILIGHSLGGIFLGKFLSEEPFPKKIQAVFMIAPPFDTEGTDDSLADFVLSSDLSLLSKQASHIFLYGSKDDPVVPFSNFEKYTSRLPGAVARAFSDRHHFIQEKLPELISDIKNL